MNAERYAEVPWLSMAGSRVFIADHMQCAKLTAQHCTAIAVVTTDHTHAASPTIELKADQGPETMTGAFDEAKLICKSNVLRVHDSLFPHQPSRYDLSQSYSCVTDEKSGVWRTRVLTSRYAPDVRNPGFEHNLSMFLVPT